MLQLHQYPEGLVKLVDTTSGHGSPKFKSKHNPPQTVALFHSLTARGVRFAQALQELGFKPESIKE